MDTPTPTPLRLQDIRVLIVDDDPDILESITAAFQAEGALTQETADGNDAVSICDEDPPDLVILDCMLPGRSGYFAIEKIKGKPDSPAVIMVTANEGKRHHEYAIGLGADRYMLKPVPLEALLTTAVELVGHLVGKPRPIAATQNSEGDDVDGSGEDAEDGESENVS